MPRGFLTEAGPRPEFAAHHGAVEHPSAEYPPRTEANVIDADITIWFGDLTSRGGRLTLLKTRQRSQGAVVVERYDPNQAASVARWVAASGRRCSTSRAIGEQPAGDWGMVERFLAKCSRSFGLDLARRIGRHDVD